MAQRFQGLRFLVAPGVTRPATAEDEPYLVRLDVLLNAAIDETEHLVGEDMDEFEREQARKARRRS